jgi:hypothetical protein
MQSVQYDGLDHASVQMLVDHVHGSGVRACFEIAPNGHTFLYVYPATGDVVSVLLWPGCWVHLDEVSNQVSVSSEMIL